MLKKLKTGLICLIIGEIISWIVSFVTLPSFIHGFLLGLSVGLKLISIISYLSSLSITLKKANNNTNQCYFFISFPILHKESHFSKNYKYET